MTLTRHRIREILHSAGIAPSRALGQNFVADPNTVRRIARLAAVGPGDHVVEIGAGLGSLTLALLETGADVVAIEKDRRLTAVIREVMDGSAADLVPGQTVNLVEHDALDLDWRAALHGAGNWVMVANLPFNIATPLVITVLESVPEVRRMLVMVQREMGERLVARPREAAYGAVSVKIAYWATARIAGRVPASVFVPRPRVESVLVEMVRRDEVAVPESVASYASLRCVVEAGFATRRKMLRNALHGICDMAAFDNAGIAPTARAEELSIEEWGRLGAGVAA